MRILRFVVMIVVSGLAVPLPAAPQVEIDTDAYNSGDRCGECHQEIHSMWRRSMHAASWTDPVFQASYQQAYLETAGRASKLCLRCHAPVAAETGDLEVQDPVSRDGITCDYCHSIEAVDLEHNERPLDAKLDGVKRGPLRDAASPAHEVRRSELHTSSEFCAGCHEYTNEHGLAVMSTYSEWKASPQAAEGRTCQICHMPMTPGDTVPLSLAPSRGKINLHDISGGHSIDQVRKAATVRILDLRRRGEDRVQVKVEVANVGSGHSIPTGMPTRKLVLEVVVFLGNREVKRFERTYQKKVADESGLPITEDHRALMASRKVLEDNRLRPGERRVERFEWVLLPKGPLRAEASLRYLYEPKLLVPQVMSIEMAEDRSPRDK